MEVLVLRAQARLEALLDDRTVLIVDRPLRPGTGTVEDVLMRDGVRSVPLVTARAQLREQVALAVLLGVFTHADPMTLLQTEAHVDAVLARLEADDRRLRSEMATRGRANLARHLDQIRAEADAILAARREPPPGAGRRAGDALHGLQWANQPELFGGKIDVDEVVADVGGGQARLRIAVTRECTETYLARWSFSPDLDTAVSIPDPVVRVDLGLDRTSGACDTSLYTAEIEARGSAGSTPLAAALRPPGRLRMDLTETMRLTSAQAGGRGPRRQAGVAEIRVKASRLAPGAGEAGYLFVHLMLRTPYGEGIVYYRIVHPITAR